MPKSWNLQDAKARLSELVDRARSGEAQIILRRGQPAAVVISYEAYEEPGSSGVTALSFFQQSPLGDTELEAPDRDEPRREFDV